MPTGVYEIYGLTIQSNHPIPGLVAAGANLPVDVQLWLDHQPPWRENVVARPPRHVSSHTTPSGEPLLTVAEVADGSHLFHAYSDGTEIFTERHGREVWAKGPPSATLDDTLTYVLGPILGFILRLQGVTALHASVVNVNGCAVALLGPAGAGKSTTAAAFATRGFPVVSDDVAALRVRQKTDVVFPGYSYLRLWPASSTMLFGSREALPRITPTWDKRYLDLNGDDYRFHAEPLPLTAIYLLAARSQEACAPRVEPMSPRDSMMALVTNSYANYLLDDAMRADEFRTASGLVSRIPVRRVVPHASPEHLGDLCSAILADLAPVPGPVGGSSCT